MDVDFVLERTRDSVSSRPIQRKRSFRDWESRTLAMLGKNLTSELTSEALLKYFSHVMLVLLYLFFENSSTTIS